MDQGIRDVMTPNPCVISPSASVLDAAELMRGNDIGDVSIRRLLYPQVFQPFAQKASRLHEEGTGARKDLDIARPAGSFPGSSRARPGSDSRTPSRTSPFAGSGSPGS